MLLRKAVLGLILFLLLASQTVCQRVESVKGPDGENSCNVVNVHFGSDQQQQASSDRTVGAPGKRGPIGPIGVKGTKGGRGEKGSQGESVNVEELKRKVADMINSTSCEELMQNHGITESGYYLIKANPLDAEAPTYRYCDFGTYSGVSSCTELTARHGAKRHGYYRFSGGFHYCPEPYTCHQLSQRDGIRESGLYQLGPPDDRFEVYCNFFSGQAVTEVWHDSMDEIKVASTCGGQGCFTRTPVYKISLARMTKITENSRECKQYIKMRCQGSVLSNVGNPFAWWVSRQGEKMLYWGGAVSKTPYHCACGETGSCVITAQKCNCDNNSDGVITQDEGYLTDKSKLPVREMKFGDVDGSSENAWHTLGKLECTGQA